MKGLEIVKGWVGELTELGLMLLALAIVLGLLVGTNLPFFGRHGQHHGMGEGSRRERARRPDHARDRHLAVLESEARVT